MPLRRRDANAKQLNVRMPPDELKSLDVWIKTHRRRAQRGRKQSGGWSDRRLPAVHNRRRSAARNQRPRRARWPDRRSIVFSATRDRSPWTNRKGESAGLQRGLVNFAKFAATSPSRRAEAQGFEAVLLTTGNKLLTGSTVVAFQRGRTSKLRRLQKPKPSSPCWTKLGALMTTYYFRSR